MIEKHLLLIAVGPVQDFIASGRKLRDLWFGSTMLSELSKGIARCLYGNGCPLIFPCVGADNAHLLAAESSYAVVNKIVAVVPEGKDPKVVLDEARHAMTRLIVDYAESALQKAHQVGFRVNDEEFREQVSDIGDFFGVWVPYKEDYRTARNAAEALMAGRKAVRSFNEPTWQGFGRKKSSLDGNRETVIADKHPEIIGLLKTGEQLDAVGLIKRCYPLMHAQHFDDLSDIAVLSYLERIAKSPEASLLLHKLQEQLKGTDAEKSREARKHSELDVYSDILYAKGDEIYKKYGSAALESLKSLHKKIGLPGAYAAVLVGDGDHMGATIDQIQTETGQRQFGKALSGFAAKAAHIVESYDGALIYSGGDDVMAYLPLHRMIDCAYELQVCFSGMMKGVLQQLNLQVDLMPTFSAGLAIVHHSAPLNLALATARKAESEAKNRGQRNALAIIQEKRSGAPRMACGKWGIVDETLKQICQLFNEQELSGTLAYDLIAVGKQTGYEIKVEAGPTPVPGNAATTCALRCLKAKLSGERGREVHSLMVEILRRHNDLRELAEWVIIARQISMEQRRAEGVGVTNEENI